MSVDNWNEQARLLIRNAILAPSSHNTQPWLFRISTNAIDLFADRTRALPVNDSEDRELTISCGCALMNLRIAAASQRLHAQTQSLPAIEEPDWLAHVSLTDATDPPAAEAALFGFIESRRTYRKRFAPREVDSVTIEQLCKEANAEGAWMRPLLNEDTRRRVTALVTEGDAAQWANPSWRRELAAWMHPRRQGDGLTVPTLAAPVAQAVVRSFDMGGGVAAKDRDLADASPVLAVLGTERDEPGDWLLAGQALQRVLLAACRLGLQASYLNQPVQVSSLRSTLRDIIGDGFPQIVLRMGYSAANIAASPRRDVEAVIFEDHGTDK